MKPKILIAVPNADGWVHKCVTMKVVAMLSDQRVTSRAIFPTHSPSENNRAKIMVDFLAGGADFLISVDADNPPRQNPVDLVFLDKPVIGLPTPVWHNDRPGEGQPPIYWNAYDEVVDGFKAHPPGTGLEAVDAVGSGCIVVARRVFAALQDKQPFMRTWDAQGRVEVGSDLAFCRKVRAAGFKVWVHWDYPCDHINELALIEVQQALTGVRSG